MSFNSDEHSFTFRFHSAEGERDLEMNYNALYLSDIFERFRDFLQGCGYLIEGQIEVIPFSKASESHESHEERFSMDHLPNNGWPFGSTMNDTIPVPVQPSTSYQSNSMSSNYNYDPVTFPSIYSPKVSVSEK